MAGDGRWGGSGLAALWHVRIRPDGPRLAVRSPWTSALVWLAGCAWGTICLLAVASDDGGPVFAVIGVASIGYSLLSLVRWTRPWLVADDVGIHVGALRPVTIPWPEVVRLSLTGTTGSSFVPPRLRIERRLEPAYVVWPGTRVAGQADAAIDDLQLVAQAVAATAARQGREPLPWPEVVILGIERPARRWR
ncbi:MAG TPA: hypothetical protein VNS19_07810 [Acidimicrobiales bacterium]|jgi:hypothetical protein|nr:hypothetical protein [Acidimicrobiales bacterium]